VSDPLLLATRSAGKLHELRPLFARAGIAVIDLLEAGIAESPDEDALERFATFEENALAKARHFHRVSGRPTVADDSGLEVMALGGQPGVRSKRWSGRADLRGQPLDDANNAMLLRALQGVEDRRARYVCVAAYVSGAREIVERGISEGEIRDEPAQGGQGFGYDPYFWSSELQASFADVPRDEKARVSHRGRAFASLVRALHPRHAST
jgi:XTP/dITP diphosphohydrolase